MGARHTAGAQGMVDGTVTAALEAESGAAAEKGLHVPPSAQCDT